MYHLPVAQKGPVPKFTPLFYIGGSLKDITLALSWYGSSSGPFH